MQQAMQGTLENIAYVEMIVGNIFYAKNFFVNALQFKHVSSKKDKETIRFLMKQGNIYIVLTSSLENDHEFTKHVLKYGDSIKKISFWSRNVRACFDKAIKHGSKAILPPTQKDGINMASIEVFNSVEHEFLESNSSFKIPGFEYDETNSEKTPMLYNIDHIATCHYKNGIDQWVEFYKNVFSFSENKNEDIYSEESGMHIIIMKSPNGKVKLPLVEPSGEKSPLHTYLKYNLGAGVHHIAFETDDIVKSVQYFESRAGELRKASPKYYEELKHLYSEQIQNIQKMAPHGIMLEQDEYGILFQIFTKPVVTRPTLFLEFVQRDKCEGFGTVNIKTLYESLEA